MRSIVLAAAAVAGFAMVGSAVPDRANAMTISTPAQLGQTSNVTDVAYVCRTWWRHGYRHRSCSWRPRPYASYGYGYYGYHRPYYRRWWW